jgi:hypothetical protein
MLGSHMNPEYGYMAKTKALVGGVGEQHTRRVRRGEETFLLSHRCVRKLTQQHMEAGLQESEPGCKEATGVVFPTREQKDLNQGSVCGEEIQ